MMHQSTKRKYKIRYIICPDCGREVRIPIVWLLGVEGIFRCRQCRRPFKTGYKMGAVISALALTTTIAAAQLLVFILSSAFLLVIIIAILPGWLLLAATMRKKYMIHKRKTFTKFAPQNRDTQAEQMTEHEEGVVKEE